MVRSAAKRYNEICNKIEKNKLYKAPVIVYFYHKKRLLMRKNTNITA